MTNQNSHFARGKTSTKDKLNERLVKINSTNRISYCVPGRKERDFY